MRAYRRIGFVVTVILLLAMALSLSSCNSNENGPSISEQTSFATPPTIALPKKETAQSSPTSSKFEETVTQTSPPPSTTEELLPSTSDETTTAKAESTTRPVITTQVKTTKPLPLPKNLQSITGIVEYFNKAANNAKTNAKKATQTLHSIDVKESSFAEIDLTSTVALGRNKNDTKNRYVALRSLPVPGESYASRLDPKGVASAICSVSGNDYLITIKLKPESGKIYQNNSYHGQAFWLSDSEGESDFYDMLKEFISEFEGESYLVNILKGLLTAPDLFRVNYNYEYSNATISCRVNQRSGRLQTISYKIHQKVKGTNSSSTVVTYEVDEARAYSYTW